MALSSEPEVGEILSADIERTQTHYRELMDQLATRLQTPAEQALLTGTHDKAPRLSGRRQRTGSGPGLWPDRAASARCSRNALSPVPPPCSGRCSSWRNRSAMRLTQRAPRLQSSQRAQVALTLFCATALLLGSDADLVAGAQHFAPHRRGPTLTAQRVSSLDLRENIEGHNRDEAGQLLLSLNTMQKPCAPW